MSRSPGASSPNNGLTLKSDSTDIDEESRFPASQFISADDVTRVNQTRIIEGYLKKKSPKGLPGLKAWQQRYFVLTPEKLKYFHDPSCAKTLGAIPVLMIEKVDISKLDREYRFDLILSGEQSRKFNLRASNKAMATKWHLALMETLELARSEGDRKKMRDFSNKYWKEQPADKEQAGPSPVERALAHLTEKNEVKSLHGIGKDSPELFLLTTALLHGLRFALRECALWRKVFIEIDHISDMKVDNGVKLQVTAELREKPTDPLPKFAVGSKLAKYVNGTADYSGCRLEVSVPGLLDVNKGEMRIKIVGEEKQQYGIVRITVSDLLKIDKSRSIDIEGGKGGKLMLRAEMVAESMETPSGGEFNTEIKYEYGRHTAPGILEFPKETPDLKDGQFKFYAPKIFQRMCSLFGIQSSEFYESICNNSFVEFVSNSKSGAFFFFSDDGRYMIKTIEQGECKCLRQMLPKYFEHCRKNPKTLLCRFYGLFRLRCNKKTHYFIIMESVFHTPKYIHLILDLKGSTTNRHASEKDLKAKPTESFTGTILKDNDIRNSDLCVDVGKDVAKQLRSSLDLDVGFLSAQGIIDYSLLVGIHYPDLPDPRTAMMQSAATGKPNKGRRRGSITSNRPLSLDYQTQVQSLDGTKVDLRKRTSTSTADAFKSVGDRGELYFVGIIDILIQFGIFKGGEYLFKAKLKGEGEKISVIPPEKYGQRFLKFMNYFIRG